MIWCIYFTIITQVCMQRHSQDVNFKIFALELWSLMETPERNHYSCIELFFHHCFGKTEKNTSFTIMQNAMQCSHKVYHLKVRLIAVNANGIQNEMNRHTVATH